MRKAWHLLFGLGESRPDYTTSLQGDGASV